MDVLYTLGNGSIYNNREIYTSLRLLKKNCKFDRIFVIGERPNELPEGVEIYHIPFKEHLSRTRNVFLKICTVCENTDISDNFLYMMDDVFIIKPIDIENYPLYHSNGIKDYPSSVGAYLREIKNTKEFLIKNNKPTLHFGVHCPIVYNKDNIRELDKIYWKYVNTYNIELNPRILYGNWFEHPNKKYIEDCKLIRDYPYLELKRLLSNKEWFSIGSRSYDGNIKKYLEEL